MSGTNDDGVESRIDMGCCSLMVCINDCLITTANGDNIRQLKWGTVTGYSNEITSGGGSDQVSGGIVGS